MTHFLLILPAARSVKTIYWRQEQNDLKWIVNCSREEQNEELTCGIDDADAMATYFHLLRKWGCNMIKQVLPKLSHDNIHASSQALV